MTNPIAKLAAVATIREFNAKDDPKVSCVPDALVLFNPVAVLGILPGNKGWDTERLASIASRVGVEPERLSPYHHVRKGLPPTIIFPRQGGYDGPLQHGRGILREDARGGQSVRGGRLRGRQTRFLQLRARRRGGVLRYDAPG